MNLLQLARAHPETEERGHPPVDEKSLEQSVGFPAAQTADQAGAEERQPSRFAQPADEDDFFHDRQFRESAQRFEDLPPDEDALVAAGEFEEAGAPVGQPRNPPA